MDDLGTPGADAALTPFVTLVATAPGWLMVLDGAGRVVTASPALQAALGTDAAGLAGRLWTDLASPAEGHLPGPPGAAAAKGFDAMALDLAGADGTLHATLASAAPIRDAGGTARGALLTLHDATGLRQTEADLRAAVEDATEASRAKSRFLAAMSHEIRTPMNAILGFAQLLRLSNLDQKRKNHVEAILSAGGTLMNLLTDLLDLSQVEAGRMRIEPRPFDLQPMLDQVSDWWLSTASDKGLRLQLTLDRGLPQRIVTDPVRLQQVLNNFLSNAIKYTETGSVALVVSQTAWRDGHARLRFEVTDTGIGMAPEQVDKLFRPFVQIESDFGKERGGWGLGLSICRNIADILGADIGVESRPGAGSTFYFEMEVPVEAIPEPAPEPVRLHAVTGDAGLRVLIAEDNTVNQDMLREMLQQIGHQVETVSNGFEAIEALIKQRFDLVLMDITMPGLDGLGATEQIRTSEGEMRAVPIIACSAHVGPEVQDRYRRVGIDAFLPKPVDPAALDSVIRQVARRR